MCIPASTVATYRTSHSPAWIEVSHLLHYIVLNLFMAYLKRKGLLCKIGIISGIC